MRHRGVGSNKERCGRGKAERGRERLKLSSSSNNVAQRSNGTINEKVLHFLATILLEVDARDTFQQNEGKSYISNWSNRFE